MHLRGESRRSAHEARYLHSAVAEWSAGELEGRSDDFHVGYWLSVYDPAQANRVESPARTAFKRIHETLP